MHQSQFSEKSHTEGFPKSGHIHGMGRPLSISKKQTMNTKKIRFQILTQAPTYETNTEVLKTRIFMDMPTSTLNTLSNKGLNKLVYDPIFRSNPDL
jgi:cobalamin biosynthesis Co2+ chelatase CbiK